MYVLVCMSGLYILYVRMSGMLYHMHMYVWYVVCMYVWYVCIYVQYSTGRMFRCMFGYLPMPVAYNIAESIAVCSTV